MKELKLALMGFGNVAQAFAKMLLEKHDEIEEKYDRDVIVTEITTDLMKTVSVIEHEPEIEQTAYGVFGDMLRVIELEA